MKVLKRLLLHLLILSPLLSKGQQDCAYKIDTITVLNNKNLDVFLTKIKGEKIITLNNKNAIPFFIKTELDCLTGKFSIANPNEKFNASCIIDDSLPDRQLQYLGKSRNMLIMSYLLGAGPGIATHILFIEFDATKITDFWSGLCLENLKSKKRILAYIKKYRYKDFGLNTNMLYF